MFRLLLRFSFVNMVSELTSMKFDHMTKRLNSKNYAIWVFQFRMMIEGKGFLGFLDGTSHKPTVPSSTDQELS
ncbi:unnamed protein product [Linum trigynum]|uniref:Retrotransposon Copia-like N-terminal domain-containing protein n=1 Tax=Linum trigynum TaxID=586398 RepID=A0AAV2CT53_9ROSI